VKDESGRILHAVGDLAHLDRLPTEALSPNGSNVVLATISNPTARFEVGMDETYTCRRNVLLRAQSTSWSSWSCPRILSPLRPAETKNTSSILHYI
jgi:hypothetical protein